MTGYPLAPLARVRRLREENAMTEYAVRTRAHQTAKQETLARRKALEEYQFWRKEEEDRRYLEILGKELPRKEIDEFKAGITALREKDSILMEAVEEAQKTEEEAAKRRDEAAQILKQRRKDKEKIDTHREIWHVGETREAERKEDLEMEEFTAKKPYMEESGEENSYD